MRFRPLMMPIFALALTVGGCSELGGWTPGSRIAEFFAANCGENLAENVPTPKAAIAAVAKGGNFCDTATALGFPVAIPSIALPRSVLEALVAINEYGREHRCW